MLHGVKRCVKMHLYVAVSLFMCPTLRVVLLLVPLNITALCVFTIGILPIQSAWHRPSELKHHRHYCLDQKSKGVREEDTEDVVLCRQ
jgi:hypothetical protein